MGLSVNTKRIQSRIDKLPILAEKWVDAVRKKDAFSVLKEFRESIENGNLNPPLKPKTIKRKQQLGYAKPQNPLRGLGMDGTRTYASSMRLYKTKNGWRVRMPAVLHHSSNAKRQVKMDKLFRIHEYGTAKIPSRPALARAYQVVLKGISKKEVDAVRAACVEYLRTGKTRKGSAILAEAARLERIYGQNH